MSEVKRWWLRSKHNRGVTWYASTIREYHEGYKSCVEVMRVEDHDRIVAELKAEVARQAKVIEKLRISMATALELESCGETSCPIPMRAMCSTPSHKELRKTLLEITAIEKGEGT